MGENTLPQLDTTKFEKEFDIETAGSVFKFTHPLWSAPPYFAEAYYNGRKSGEILLTALTDKGYEALCGLFRAKGVDVPEVPDIRIHTTMMILIERLLNKKLTLNPYEKKFEKEASPEEGAALQKLNHFLSLALPIVNTGKKPDVGKLSKEAGIDPVEAASALKQVMAKRLGPVRID